MALPLVVGTELFGFSLSAPRTELSPSCSSSLSGVSSSPRDALGYPLISPDPLPNFLDGNLVSIPAERFRKAIHSIRLAERSFRRFLGPEISPHQSRTHSWYDVMVQAMSVIWHLDDKKQQESVAYAIMALHLLDDLADHGEGPQALAASKWSSSNLIWPLLDVSDRESNSAITLTYELIGKAGTHLPFFGHQHRQLLESGIRRMLVGGPIFSSDVEMSEVFIGNHLAEVVNVLPPTSRLRRYIRDRVIHPFTVALSIKPLYETIDALSMENPIVHDSFLKSLFLGSLVYVHNDDAERDSGESQNYSQLTYDRLLQDMEVIGGIIKTMPLERRQQIVVSFPAAIEAFRDVLQKKGLLRFYLGFLQDRRIKPYLHPEIDLEALFLRLEGSLEAPPSRDNF